MTTYRCRARPRTGLCCGSEACRCHGKSVRCILKVREGVWGDQSDVRIGVTAIVNMCEEFPGHESLYADLGIDQCWLPTTDYCNVTPEVIAKGVAFIHRKIQVCPRSCILSRSDALQRLVNPSMSTARAA